VSAYIHRPRSETWTEMIYTAGQDNTFALKVTLPVAGAGQGFMRGRGPRTWVQEVSNGVEQNARDVFAVEYR